MVIRELLTETCSSLKGIDNHIFEAHLLLRSVLKLSPMDMVLLHNKEVNAKSIKTVRCFAKRRLGGEPIQYILGTQEFMGIEFLISKNVLIPRSDTETLVEVVLQSIGKSGASVLDLCSGSGCVGLGIAYHNKRIYLTGVDISPDAVELSRKNAEKLGVAERSRFELKDILTEHLFGRYDVITANPPYIRSDVIPTLMREVKDFEPHLALDGGADGLLFYRRITSEAKKLLVTGGLLAFEIGYDQAESVSSLMKESFYDVTVTKDLSGNDRVVSGRKY